jgi:hypothetical protein
MTGGSSSFFTGGGGDPFAHKTTKTAQYAANVRRARAKKSGGHHSLLGNIVHDVAGVVGNGIHEARDMAVGSATGFVHLAENPNELPQFGQAIVDDYKTRYGKLLHGDFSDLSKHPLSYILDAASIASLGAGSLAKVGLLSREGGAAEIGFAKGAGGVKVHLSANPLKRGREKTYLALQKHVIPVNAPVVGMAKRAARTLDHAQRDYEAHLSTSARQFARVAKGFKDHEEIALDAVIRGIRPAKELTFLRKLHGSDPVPREAQLRLNDPKANALYDKVVAVRKGKRKGDAETDKIITAYEHHSLVAQEVHDNLTHLGRLDPEEAKVRAVLHHIVMRKVFNQPLPDALRKAKKDLSPDELAARPEHAEALAHAIEDETGFKPTYTPDNALYAHRNKGTSTNEAKVFQAGMRAPAVAHILDRHAESSRLVAAEAGKDSLLRAAVEQKSDKLPKGWVWLNENIQSKDWLKENLPRFEEEGRQLRESGSPTAVYEASLRAEKMPSHKLAVPESALQDVVNQRTRMLGTVNDMLGVGTGLWKKIILGMRPAFLTGNLVGNQILYHLHNGIGASHLARAGERPPRLSGTSGSTARTSPLAPLRC